MKGIRSLLLLLAISVAGSPLLSERQNDTEDMQGPATADVGGCTATSFGEVESVLRSCAGGKVTLKDINVPAGGQLKFSNLKGGTITLVGRINFEPSKGRGADKVLIMMEGCTGTKLVGAEGSKIMAHGEAYWDGSGGNSGSPKPKFFRIQKCTDVHIEDIYVVNTPVHSFAISGSKKVTLTRITINNKDGNKPCAGGGGDGKRSCGHNTDGFGVSGSQGVTIQDSNVYNQDDCLAVNSGSDITFKNNYCDGGHGISIGSIKSGAHVSGVKVTNCTIAHSENGVRIKTYDDAKDASVSNVTYSNITLSSITKFGIVVQQDYRNGGPTGKAGSNVPIKGVEFKNIHGNMAGSKNNKVYVLCGSGTCTGWQWSGIKISGGGTPLKSPPCRNADSSVQSSAICRGGEL